MRTVFADELVGQHTLEEVVDCLLLNSAFDQTFNSIHKHVEELINIFLHIWINRLAIEVFKRLTELLWVKVLFLNFHQATKYAFNLIKNIFVFRFVMIFVFHFNNSFSERRDHVQLLQDRVHIAYAAQVLKTDESRQRPFLLLNMD